MALKVKRKRKKSPGYMGVLYTLIRFPLCQSREWREQNSRPVLRNERGRKNHYNLGNCFFPFLSFDMAGRSCGGMEGKKEGGKEGGSEGIPETQEHHLPA